MIITFIDFSTWHHENSAKITICCSHAHAKTHLNVCYQVYVLFVTGNDPCIEYLSCKLILLKRRYFSVGWKSILTGRTSF